MGVGVSSTRAAGDFWLGQWSITLPGSEHGVLGIDRMSQTEAMAEWTNRAHQIGPNVKPRSEDCMAYLHATYTWNGGGTWVGCSKHVSGVAVVTEDNFLMGLTSDATGIGAISVGQNPASLGGISVDHSKSCHATGNATTYSCTTLFTGHRADKVPTGTTKTISAPRPGQSLALSSPLLPADESEVQVTVTAPTEEELKYNHWEYIESRSEAAIDRLANGLLFLECWDVTAEFAPLFNSPGERFRSCISFIQKFYNLKLPDDLAPRSAAGRTTAASGCSTKRLTLRLVVRKKKVVSVRVVKRGLTSKSVRFSCTSSGSQMQIKIDGRRKGALRERLGKRLRFLVTRPKKAPRATGKLTVTFGWK